MSYVWPVFHGALEQDPGLKGFLTDEGEFFNNVKTKGKKEFIDSELWPKAQRGSQDDAWY